MRHGLITALLVAGMFLRQMPALAGAAPSLSVIGTFPGPDGGWDIASVDAEARRLYIAHGDAVMAVDLDSGKVTPKLVDGKRLHSVVPLSGGRALSTNGGDNTATLFDGATGKVIAAIATGLNPDVAILEPSSGLVLVMDSKGGDITLIDPKTATSPGRITVGGKLEFAVADGAGRVFVNVEDKAEIAVIDMAGGRKVTAHYPLTGCDEPSGLALDPSTALLLAACANRKAVAVRAKDGTVVATLPIGERPDGAIYDARRKLFFIPCGAGSISVIGEKSGMPTVIATIPTANGARTAALDPKTGKLYLPTADFKAPAQGEQRHTVVPGTFRVLVVGEK